MSNARHTPGPWNSPAPTWNLVTDSDGILIALVSMRPEFEKRHEPHANARLITASPELLEALEKALHVMEINDLAWTDEYRQGEAVAAKAKGTDA